MIGQSRRQSSNEQWVLVTAVLASSMAFIDATALNVALPAIQSQSQATGTELFWIVNSYAVVTAALILFGGALGDGFGRRRVFAIGISLFVAASVGCGMSPDTQSLILARALQGFGAALMIPGSLALIAATTPAARRGQAIGIWSACSVVMTALGPVIGGALADIGWWRAIFFINLPLGVLSLTVLWTKVNVPAGRQAKPVDYLGAVGSVLALAGINYALLQVASSGWTDLFVVLAIAVGTFVFGAFLWHESRTPSPLLPLELFRDRSIRAACQLTVCFYAGVYGMLFFLALNLIQVQGYSASRAGMAQLPVMLFVILLSPVAGTLVDRRGPRLPLLVGGLIGGLGFMMLALPGVTTGVNQYWTTFFPSLSLLGVAMGMSAAPLSTTIMNSVPVSHVGIGAALNSALARLSSVLGIAVLGPIALLTFRRSLMDQADTLALDEHWSAELRRESWRLADANLPAGMPAELGDAIQSGIRLAYVDAFRVVSCVAGVVVVVSTLLAATMLDKTMLKKSIPSQ